MSALRNCHPERPLGARAHGAPFHAPLITAIGEICLDGAWNGDVRASRPGSPTRAGVARVGVGVGRRDLLRCSRSSTKMLGQLRVLIEDFYYAAINSREYTRVYAN